MKIAVIDLGTNTCNLLIAKTEASDYHVIHQSKQLVRLGDNNIKKNIIGLEAIERTIIALKKQYEVIRMNGAEKVILIATSALRSAANKDEVCQRIKNELDLDVTIISGDKEAELIFKGVLLAFENDLSKVGILDIGGGSNEIILAKDNKIYWKESQPAGMARVINQFHLSDPISATQTEQLCAFFGSVHKKAIEQFKDNGIQTLVGCSGAFDTIADIIDGVNPGEKKRKTQKIEISQFYSVYNQIVTLSHSERKKIKGMDSVRVDLIVPALILIEHLILQTGISEIIQTDFALREGVMFEEFYSNYPQ